LRQGAKSALPAEGAATLRLSAENPIIYLILSAKLLNSSFTGFLLKSPNRLGQLRETTDVKRTRWLEPAASALTLQPASLAQKIKILMKPRKELTTVKFLLDTNFLLIPARFRVDIFSELTKFGKPELFTLDLVLKELHALAGKGGKVAGQARVALLQTRKELVMVLCATRENTDQELARIAKEKSLVVCTLDRALARLLKKEKIPVIILRQKKYLVSA
jgi:rRNA-processing protein FCF1